MKILNYSIDDYYLQVGVDAGLVTIPGKIRGVCNIIRFADKYDYPPDIIEDKDFLDDTWYVVKGDICYALVKGDRKHNCDYNILQVGSYLKDGVTLAQSVSLLVTRQELASIRVLAAGDVKQIAHNVYAMGGFILIPKTARYVIDDYVYSCATDRALCRYDYNALISGRVKNRFLVNPVKLVMR